MINLFYKKRSKSNFMLLNFTKSIFFITIITVCSQNNLTAMQNAPKQITEKSSFEANKEYLEHFVKNINNPRIVYKNGQVIFYPNPNVQKIHDKIQLVTILLILCTISIILIPISFLLLIAEIVFWCKLSEKNNLLGSKTPHIILDEYGIKIRNQKTFWIDIKNISKEEITKYLDGWEQSRQTIFTFSGKRLNCLFTLNDQDDYIEMSFDKLISLIYYFLEKSKTEFTQNMQKTTLSENTRSYPVYTYR
jgi:hypothetical protein